MRYFVPTLAPGWLDDGPASSPGDHFGGLPWGLPEARWPVCSRCGAAMSFVCQLAHHPDRLRLGAEGDCMFVFWCLSDPGSCEVWEPDVGTNAVFVLKAAERTHSFAMTKVNLLPYLVVTGWSEREDGVAPEQLKQFFDADHFLELDDASFQVLPGTRLGGTPFWPQALPVCTWEAGDTFVLQLDSAEWLAAPAPCADELGCPVHVQGSDGVFTTYEPQASKANAPPQGVMVVEGGSWCVDRFGDFTVYVFLNEAGPSRGGRLCMQR